MAEFNLRKITIRNWTTIQEAEVEFPPKGLIFLLGNNLASEGHLDGSGAGKTNFGTAISRAVLGVPDKLASKLSRHKRGNTYVRVAGDLRGEDFVIETGYKCQELSKTGEGLRFQVGSGEPISRSHVSLTKEELTRVIGVVPELARWVTFINGDKLQFDELSQRDAVELLMVALRQPRWSAVSKRSRKVLDVISEEMSLNETRVADTRRAIAACETAIVSLSRSRVDAQVAYDKSLAEQVERLKKESDDLQKLTEELAKIETRQAAISKEIERITKEKAESYAALENKRLELDGQLKMAREPIRGLIQDYTRKQDSKAAAWKSLHKPETCPTCGQPWTLDHEHKARLTESLERAQMEELESKQKLEAAQLQVSKLQGEFDAVCESLSQLNVKNSTVKLSVEHRKLGEQGDSITRDVRQIELTIERLSRGPDKSGIVKAETELAAKENQLQELGSTLVKLEKDLTDGRSSVGVINYWINAFDPKGIMNMLLREAIGPLNAVTKRVSQVMVGGMIEVTFDTRHELQSGEERDELVVNVKAVEGADELDMTSKGESSLANLIISEALAEISQVHGLVNFVWFDEVTKNFPAHVRSVFYQYLKDKANRLDQLIFIVDHSDEVMNYADYVLLAEKTVTKGTTLKWINR